jgi:peptide/nickel transport system permease protein
MMSFAGIKSGSRDSPVRKYLLRRGVFALGTLLGVSMIVFVVLRILPGDPLVAILGVEGHARMLPADRVRIMADLGLSDPLPVQYVRWLRDIATGQLGKSFFRGDTVRDLILHRGPLSAEIALLALAVSWIVGLPAGIASAVKPNGWLDTVARLVSIVFIAVPGFWLGLLIVLALLFWFGYRAPLANVSLFSDPVANLQIVVGPAIVLGLGQAAYIARMARSSLLEVIREDYVRTARAKGLSGRLVISLHALPNALLPVITLSGILLGFVLAGSIPVERAFGTPGLGYAMFTAVNERDVFVMQNLVFLYAVVFVMLNILVDFTIAWLDPRIRYQ